MSSVVARLGADPSRLPIPTAEQDCQASQTDAKQGDRAWFGRGRDVKDLLGSDVKVQALVVHKNCVAREG